VEAKQAGDGICHQPPAAGGQHDRGDL